jgi:hypothetical protein
MASSKSTTVAGYLAELPEEWREVVSAVRAVILNHLPHGYREGMNWGMIAYEVPLEVFRNIYNRQPLCLVALAAQKNYFALYLNCIDESAVRKQRLRAGFLQAGKKLDMGKSCIRFKKAEDLALDVIGRVIAETSVDGFIARYEESRKER